MKRFPTLAACLMMVSFLAPSNAQGHSTSYLIDNYGKIRYEILTDRPVPHIGDFAESFAYANMDNPMLEELFLWYRGNTDQKSPSTVIDEGNSYLFYCFEGDSPREIQMCGWTLTSATERFGIKILDCDPDGNPLHYLEFFDFNASSRTFVPVEVNSISEMRKLDREVGLHFPRQGTHIVVGTDVDGFFFFEDETFEFGVNEYPTLVCFICDEDPTTNVRLRPSGKVLAKIENEEEDAWQVSVYAPVRNWWKIRGSFATSMLQGTRHWFADAGTDCWIHATVLGVYTKNYADEVFNLRAEPNRGATVVAKIAKEVLVHPLDITEDGQWVQVEWEGFVGWIQSRLLCANPFTTCS